MRETQSSDRRLLDTSSVDSALKLDTCAHNTEQTEQRKYVQATRTANNSEHKQAVGTHCCCDIRVAQIAAVRNPQRIQVGIRFGQLH